MAALVQTYAQPAGTVTMLQSRSTSNQNQAGQYIASQPHRNTASVSVPGPLTRTGTAPIQPYAFTSTPSLHSTRSASTTSIPQTQTLGVDYARPRNSETPSPSTGPNNRGSWDDTFSQVPRSLTPTVQQAAQKSPTKATNTPDRYRRSSQLPPPRQQDVAPAVSANAVTGATVLNVPDLKSPNRSAPRAAIDDMHIHRRASDEEAKRLRRRSMHTLDSVEYMGTLAPSDFRRPVPAARFASPPTPPSQPDRQQKSLRLVPHAVAGQSMMHARSPSSESVVSSKSNRSRPSSAANRSVGTLSPTLAPPDQAPKSDQPRSEVGRRSGTSSPLSQSSKTHEPPRSQSESALVETPQQPAPSLAGETADMDSSTPRRPSAQETKSGKPKKKPSRLRRALSFGSAADFRKTAGPDGDAEGVEESSSSRPHKEPTANEIYDAEQAKIAQKQEEGGIGSSIYGGKFFAGSTDNLSISSTASSASIMIRKMGRGVKRSTRSLVGLFRPKSTAGSPTVESPIPEASQAAVTMITVEAEREKLNSIAGSQDDTAGSGSSGLMENNDAAVVENVQGVYGGSEGSSRKSVLGGDRERAEVLAAVRKGILKRGSSSPTGPTARPVDPQASTTSLDLPLMPNMCDSPNSSAPSTPNDEAQGHRRTESVIGNEDYFVAAMRLRQDTRSAPVTVPGTPQGLSKRSATFSPRIVFYDTWPSQEYDRRGEVATCNRLTPMLAQQIKEELNTFKMEMEVHENSKIYTQFF